MTLFFKNLLFTVVVPGTVVVYGPLAIADGSATVSVGGRVAAVLLLVSGAAIYAWCVWDFASFGRGTPAPIDAPKRLVIRGLYRYVRNPMYLGVLTVVLGWAVLFGEAILLVYAASVWTGFHLFILFYEERHLRREFGGEYDAYCARVGRWLPRLRPNAQRGARPD